MSKYGPLRDRLAAEPSDVAPMSFAEIEALLGFPLPPSARRHRAFWSNNPDNNVMTRAWREAGFQAMKVDLVAETLIFRRDPPPSLQEAVAPTVLEVSAAPFDAARPVTTAVRHHAFGCMKGTATLRPDVDYTEPADPDWGRRAWSGA